MPKDYARRARDNAKKWKKKKSKIDTRLLNFPWKAIFFLVIVIILLTVGIVYIKSHPFYHKALRYRIFRNAIKKDQSIDVIKHTPALMKTSSDNIQFDFYTMLPKMSVQVATPENTVDNTAKNAVYLLQLASLSNLKDAQTFEKKVNDLGFHSKITSTRRGNTTWYRVQIGPLKGLDHAQALQEQLQAKDIEGILIQISHS